MKRSRRLEPIAQLAERAEQRAAAACSDSRRELDECAARLEQLRSARDEYLEGASGPGVTGAGRMQELRRFLTQLDAAIMQLEGQLEHKRSSFEHRQASWHDSRNRSQALGDIVARSRDAERRAEASREQREIDDRPRRPPRP